MNGLRSRVALALFETANPKLRNPTLTQRLDRRHATQVQRSIFSPDLFKQHHAIFANLFCSRDHGFFCNVSRGYPNRLAYFEYHEASTFAAT